MRDHPGAAVAHALLSHGVGALTVCDIDRPKADRLAAVLGERFGRTVAAVAGSSSRWPPDARCSSDGEHPGSPTIAAAASALGTKRAA